MVYECNSLSRFLQKNFNLQGIFMSTDKWMDGLTCLIIFDCFFVVCLLSLYVWIREGQTDRLGYFCMIFCSLVNFFAK